MLANKRIWAACALLVGVSFLVYAPVWTSYFLGDDFAYAGMYANRPFTDWVEIVAKDWTAARTYERSSEGSSGFLGSCWQRFSPGWPAGYTKNQIHPDRYSQICNGFDNIIDTGETLTAWIKET